MKTTILCSLAGAGEIATRAVAENVSMQEYLEILTQAVPLMADNTQAKAITSIGAFSRWIHEKKDEQALICEALLAEWLDDMQQGRHTHLGGRKYAPYYAKQGPNYLWRLHNLMLGRDKRILRPLVDLRSYPRFALFNTFSETTRKAILWYEKNGTRPGGRQLQTAQTRTGAINEIFALLAILDARGIEDLTEDIIKEHLGEAEDSSPEYRRNYRRLCMVKSLTRSCHDNGLLPADPLAHLPNKLFTAYAVRHFITPEGMSHLRDLSSLDMNDLHAVRNRLICLLFADLAIRKSELASLSLAQVNPCDDSWEFVLGPENQKMQGKDRITMYPYYPETVRLLNVYVPARRVRGSMGPLFLDSHGEPASSESLYKVVVAECAANKIFRYGTADSPPSPHDLRRSFAMCNVAPLGLNLHVMEVARRLRDSVDVVQKHYYERNPLIEKLKAREYVSRQSSGSINAEVERQAIAAMKSVGCSPATIDEFRSRVDLCRQKEQTESKQADSSRSVRPSGIWISEEDAVEKLKTAWRDIPVVRTLRDYLSERNLTSRRGEHGRLAYDAAWVDTMIKEYTTLRVAIDGESVTRREKDSILAGVDGTLRIGRLVLIPRSAELRVAQAVLAIIRHEKETMCKDSKTGRTETAKQGTARPGQNAGIGTFPRKY